MLTIETKELEISDKLKKKVEMVCRFTNTKPIYQKGSIKSIKETNIAYVRPHVITIKNNKYLMFEETDYVFVNGYEKKIMFKDLENYIKLN
ncbi:MAG: hypothetical protein IJ094_01620 [Bacilli bacterium]|nr:hypothetical protein [Bacilli bacterium]